MIFLVGHISSEYFVIEENAIIQKISKLYSSVNNNNPTNYFSTKMHSKQYFGLCLVALVMCQAFALPQVALQQQIEEASRKFAEKPNASKKVGLDDLDDISSNSIAVSTSKTHTHKLILFKSLQNQFYFYHLQEGNGGGFTWSSILSMLMQMLLGQNANIAGPSKNEIDDGVPASPWTNLLSVGLRVLTAFLGGPQQQVDGIDKVDNQSSSPMQVQMLP